MKDGIALEVDLDEDLRGSPYPSFEPGELRCLGSWLLDPSQLSRNRAQLSDLFCAVCGLLAVYPVEGLLVIPTAPKCLLRTVKHLG